MLDIQSIANYLADEALKKAVKDLRPMVRDEIEKIISSYYPIPIECEKCGHKSKLI